MKLLNHILILGFLMMQVGFAETTNCSISILSERNSGEKIRIKFNSLLGSKQECLKLAQMHQPNFNPEAIRSKKVSFKWTGPETKPVEARMSLKFKKKNPSMLAKSDKSRKLRVPKSR